MRNTLFRTPAFHFMQLGFHYALYVKMKAAYSLRRIIRHQYIFDKLQQMQCERIGWLPHLFQRLKKPVCFALPAV